MISIFAAGFLIYLLSSNATEMALGPLAIATFERTKTREEANEIFVARYMAGEVARFV